MLHVNILYIRHLVLEDGPNGTNQAAVITRHEPWLSYIDQTVHGLAATRERPVFYRSKRHSIIIRLKDQREFASLIHTFVRDQRVYIANLSKHTRASTLFGLIYSKSAVTEAMVYILNSLSILIKIFILVISSRTKIQKFIFESHYLNNHTRIKTMTAVAPVRRIP